jgi:hypothetical protein
MAPLICPASVGADTLRVALHASPRSRASSHTSPCYDEAAPDVRAHAQPRRRASGPRERQTHAPAPSLVTVARLRAGECISAQTHARAQMTQSAAVGLRRLVHLLRESCASVRRGPEHFFSFQSGRRLSRWRGSANDDSLSGLDC